MQFVICLSWARSSSIWRGSIGTSGPNGFWAPRNGAYDTHCSFSPGPIGACGISTAMPSHVQAATIAAAAAANSAAATAIASPLLAGWDAGQHTVETSPATLTLIGGVLW